MSEYKKIQAEGDPHPMDFQSGIGRVVRERDALLKDLTAAEQKYAALVEDVVDFCKAVDMAEDAQGSEHYNGWLGDAHDKAKALEAALAQQDQPAGEWITINEDGSNLPEPNPDAYWKVVFEVREDEELVTNWQRATPGSNVGHCRDIAYWSAPFIPPVIPEHPETPAYTAPSERKQDED